MDIFQDVWDLLKKSQDAFSVAGAIVLAILGYAIKYVTDLRIRRHDAQLTFVTSQLRDLYGPLFLLSHSNDKSWQDFRSSFRPGKRMFDPDNPLSQDEQAEYVRWLETAFVPCNAKIRQVIENNAHLFEGGRAPNIVLELLSHFDELNVLLSKLKDGKGESVFPKAQYPKGFASFVLRDYNAVVSRFSRLATKRRRSLFRRRAPAALT